MNQTSNTRPSRLQARLKRAGLVLLIVGIAVGWTFRNPWFRGNFGVVDDGQVYRSAQPMRELASVIKAKEIATVLNLRGGSDADSWYAAEVAETRRLGVDFYDFPLTATDRPSRKQLLTLLDLMDRCPYPLLIHCKSGSDRTGLVSGLYLMSRKGIPPEQAEGAFSVYYGHVPILGTRHLHEPFDEYAAWLADRKLPHTPARLRDWLIHDYRSPEAFVEVPPLPTGPRDRKTVRASGHSVPR